MSIQIVSRELAAFQRRLAQLGNDTGEGGVQLAREDLAALIEELRSTNEELQSINRELEEKNTALARLNADLHHLLDNIDVAVVLLDGDLRITRFTPAVTNIFPLRGSDRGRRLTDFSSKPRDVDLAADLNQVLRSGADIEREVRIKANHRSHALLMRVRPCRTLDGSINGIVLSFFDVDTISMAAHAEMARYAALSRASGDAILGLSLDGVVNTWNRGAERLLGFASEEMVGRHISILAPEGSETEQGALLEQIRSGNEVPPYDTVRRHKDGSLVQVSIRAAPILSPEQVPIGISETMRDIADRKRGEERNALLTRELAHRTKNLLSLVHATMVQTAEHSTSKESFIQSVDHRLRAMSQAHDLLIENNLKGAAVSDLVRSCLKPFIANEASLDMQGPHVQLKADVVHNLSLVLHELATNALKYGALTHAHGKVVVKWALDGAEVEPARFRMSWREVDGPRVAPPHRTGFGTKVISSAPKHELGAKVFVDYQPAGFHWSLDMPADRAAEGVKLERSNVEPSRLDTCVQLNDHIIDLSEVVRQTLGERVKLSTSLAPRLGPIQVDPSKLRAAIMSVAAHARDAMAQKGKFVIETRKVVLYEQLSHSHPGEYVQLSLTHTGPGTLPADLSTAYAFVKQSGGHISTESEVGSGTTINFHFPCSSKAQQATEEPT
jgi:two-component system CheB/CheR fusion protein